MKRIHLFEFEDLSWYPAWLRRCTTRLIMVMHRLLGTADKMAGLVAHMLKKTGIRTITDFCSGSGGPMPQVIEILHKEYGLKNVQLTLTDLYPDYSAAEAINQSGKNHIGYSTVPVDARSGGDEVEGLRTMVGSFHHMKPEEAKEILRSAIQSQAPILIFEISDNSMPTYLWWISIPINLLMTLCITPMVRPMSWQQLVFTYLIPIIPICFAWDGAVSNVRTYTHDDIDKLLTDIDSQTYSWEKGSIDGITKQLYLIGMP